MKKAMLSLVTLIALLLRVWGADFGLPYLYHVDEPAYVRAAIALGKGDLHTKPYDPTGFANILFVEYGVLYLVGRLVGAFQSLQAFREFYAGNVAFFILLSRYTSAILGTATVVFVYVLGKRVRSECVGLSAAGLLAVAFLHVRDSHFGTPDIAATSAVTLCMTLCITAFDTQRRRALLLAGIAAGIATAFKWTLLPILIPVVLVGLSGVATGQSKAAGWHLSRRLLIALGGFLLGFAIVSFQILLKPAPYWTKVIEEYTKTVPESRTWQVDSVPGWWFYLRTLGHGVGVTMLLLAIVAMSGHLVLSLSQSRYRRIVLLSFPLLCFVVMGSTRHYHARYALPLIPFVTLFVSEAVGIASAWVHDRWMRVGWLGVALAVMTIGCPLAKSIRCDLLMTRQDTRTLAREWIEEHIPAGAKIAVDWPVLSPPLYGSWSLAPYSNKQYEITVAGERGLPRYTLDWYRDQGLDYLVTSSFVYNMQLTDREQDAEHKAFYALLDAKYPLIYAFRPYTTGPELVFIHDEIYGPVVDLWRRQRPGPTLKVYRIQ